MAAITPPATDRLRNVLRFELARGCEDQAVIGGLDALLTNLLGSSQPGSLVEEAVLALPAHSYGGMPREARRGWIERALVILSGRSTSNAQTRKPTPEIESIQAAHASAKPSRSPTSRAAPAALKTRTPLAIESPVVDLPGVGPSRAEALNRLGIARVRDLIFHFPNRHDDYSHIVPISALQPGEQQTVVAHVWSATAIAVGRTKRKSSELIVGDETGNIQVIFFNNPYPATRLRTNQRVTLSGKVSTYQGQRQMQNPEWEPVDEGSDIDRAIHTGRLVPVYPLTQGLQNRTLRRFVRAAVDRFAGEVVDPLPAGVRATHGFPTLPDAIRQAHYPDNHEALEQARRRLAFDELLMLQLSVLARRAQRTSSAIAAPLPLAEVHRSAFIDSIPFPLTGSQQKAIDAILDDLAGQTPMTRLLQGDVGSGKTVVAAAALVAAVKNGYQSVIMAPTEILAEQHFRTLCGLFGGEPEAADYIVECRPPWLERRLRIALLRGGLRAKAKREVQEALALGLIDVVVGTQALIQGTVEFKRLGMTIIDEQHRFGVGQRSTLIDKGENTHVLVMTATPIPRTLALSVYGDLDISVIDEMPAGRKLVKTRIVEPHQRDYAYRFVLDQVEQGFQAFVICPLVEESEVLDVRAATEEYEHLRTDVFPDVPVSLLHGRMSAAEKERVMRDFRDRTHRILVSTAVVEVGIDIPGATVIMIEGAERFGLAQLHQFRGRVGRSGDQSYCLLLTDSASQEVRERLHLVESVRDGLELAEADLRLRGPGDYFGTRQSGLPALRQARLTDVDILELARADAVAILDRNRTLEGPEMAELKRRLDELAARAGEAN